MAAAAAVAVAEDTAAVVEWFGTGVPVLSSLKAIAESLTVRKMLGVVVVKARKKTLED